MASRFNEELSSFGISLAQWGALLAIDSKIDASPSDVAERVGIDRGATTRLIARMEAKGLVTRRSHDADGRSVVLSLTPETKAQMPRLLALSKQVNQEALDLLTPSEADALLKTLTTLLTRLQR